MSSFKAQKESSLLRLSLRLSRLVYALFASERNSVKLKNAFEDRIEHDDTEESILRSKMRRGKDTKAVLHNLILVAKYCLKYVRSQKNVKKYLDIYPVLWNTPGGGKLLTLSWTSGFNCFRSKVHKRFRNTKFSSTKS